jgi:hypothetical protein
MDVVITVTKSGTKSIVEVKMALGKTVEESLKEAEANLRNALAFSARSERPYVVVQISDIIQKIDTLISIDSLLDKYDEKFGNK